MKVAIGQLCSSSNISKNLKTVLKIIENVIATKDVKILFLPEATDYISSSASHSIELSKNVENLFLNPLLSYIKNLNKNQSVKLPYISIGIHLPSTTTTKTEKVRNLNLLIDPNGEIISKYQKLHLFDVDIPQGPILKESNSVEKGNEIVDPISIENTPAILGLAICYDIRFPELALKLRKKGANIIIFPSAFTVKTGEAHWEILSKSRAIDTQSFIINAAQCGKHNVGSTNEGSNNGSTRISYGDSLIIDPWGKILNRCKKFNELTNEQKENSDEYYEIVTADLDFNELDKIRINMPLIDHRRNDIFGEL
ncbi:NIT2 [Candida pseudojiufengensis]|uniref:NIT2 n=1 Tax=Candida pseudojiufengensis TaxID=497109 RepID=UPI00222409F5|nr:NIT2 [Candida pseudojiufengensis]KAI5961862.1 NIT2 [Candida pseudojiufengensis]